MSRQWMIVLVCLALVTACSAKQLPRADPHSITSGPANDAVDEGEPVTFTCSASPWDRVQYIEYATNPAGEVISDGEYILPGHENAPRYSMAYDNETAWYNLTISPTEMGDGGLYVCSDGTTLSASADLVLLGSLNTSTLLPTDGVVLVGVYYSIDASLAFKARDGVTPQFHWSGPAPYDEIPTQKQNNTLWSSISFTVDKSHNGGQFQLIANFTDQSGFGGPIGYAWNIPTWEDTYVTPTLTCHYPPENLPLRPVKPSYEIGDVLTCTCDANPAATYTWTDMDTMDEYPGDTITLTAAMVGQRVLRCEAENSVGTANVFANITINPTTTTTQSTTTTTTPTTTPPAVSDCYDLTGRWEFDRSADSMAVLCIYVDGEQNGLVTGLLWNDTKTEAYYINIIGRTRNNIYDETGFIGMWPLGDGVSAFAAECHRCHGVETFLVNLLSRSSTDNEFCGDGGNVIPSVEYDFHRVPVSYPCAETYGETKAIFRQRAEEAIRRDGLKY